MNPVDGFAIDISRLAGTNQCLRSQERERAQRVRWRAIIDESKPHLLASSDCRLLDEQRMGDLGLVEFAKRFPDRAMRLAGGASALAGNPQAAPLYSTNGGRPSYVPERCPVSVEEVVAVHDVVYPPMGTPRPMEGVVRSLVTAEGS